MTAVAFVPPFRLDIPTCIFDGCDTKVQSRGLCAAHYVQWRRTGSVKPKRGALPPRMCGFDGCDRKHSRNGWCATHSLQALNGTPMTPIGARRKRFVLPASSGYVKVYAPNHPNSQARGYVLQHVLVMSAVLGRPLRRDENVHHKNGDRADNRPDNLELWCHSQPKGQRIEDKVAWAIELLRTYEPERLAKGVL